MSTMSMSCTCPICYEDIADKNKTTTSCGHCFHSSCITKYVATHIQSSSGSPKCPCCRTPLYEDTPTPVVATEGLQGPQGLNRRQINQATRLRIALRMHEHDPATRNAVQAVEEIEALIAELDNNNRLRAHRRRDQITRTQISQRTREEEATREEELSTRNAIQAVQAVEAALADLDNNNSRRRHGRVNVVDDTNGGRGRVEPDGYLGAYVEGNGRANQNSGEPYPYHIHPVDGTVRRTDTITRTENAFRPSNLESSPWRVYMVDSEQVRNNIQRNYTPSNNNTKNTSCIIM